MQDKSIFIDEDKVKDLITESKQLVDNLEQNSKLGIKDAFINYENKKNSLISEFEDKKIEINNKINSEKEKLESRNIIFNQVYSEIEESFLAESKEILKELEYAILILKKDEEKRYENEK